MAISLEKKKQDIVDHFAESAKHSIKQQPASVYFHAMVRALKNESAPDGSPLPEAFCSAMLATEVADELGFLGPDAGAHEMWIRKVAALHLKSCLRVLEEFGTGWSTEVYLARIRDMRLPVQ